MAENESGLMVLARRQHGVFSRAQASAAGVTPTMIKGRLRSGRWERVDWGIYCLAGTPSSWHQRVLAACLAGPAVASHRSAGRLWRFPQMPDGLVEVTANRHRRRHASDVTWHESYLLTPDQLTEIQGIQVTGALRTFLDLAGVLTRDELEVVADDAIRRGLFTAFGALGLVEKLGPRRRGTSNVRELLARRVPRDRTPESVLETRFLQLVRGAGYPEPLLQYEIRVGDRTIRVDFAYPGLKVAIELDGSEFHWGQRAEIRDHRRDELLGQLGWLVLRFTWREVHDFPGYVTSALRPALAAEA